MAGDVDRPSRQPGPETPSGREGRRPSGVVGVDGLDHDRAVLRAPAGAGPRVGQAARLAGAARDRVPARAARRAVSDDAARVRRAAELPEPAEGSRCRRTSRRARSGSARRRRSGARSRTATWRGTSRCRRAAGRSRCSATPSSTKARSGRRSSTRSCPHLGEVLWIVDLNRQSLDRIVPDIAAGRIASMFEAAGWHTITVKYGRWLRELFDARRRRRAARGASTRCPTRSTSGCCAPRPGELRERLPGSGRGGRDVAALIADLDDDELLRRDPRSRRP